MTLRPLLLPLRLLLLLLISGAVCRAEAEVETESPVRTLQVETLGSLADGRIIDTSLTRDPLVIELGQKQVIPGRSEEQSFLLTWLMERVGTHHLSQPMQWCSMMWS